MIILKRQPAVDGTLAIRMIGVDTTIPVDDAIKYAADGQLFFKANKPATLADLKTLVGA